jgi:hypothetical protein
LRFVILHYHILKNAGSTIEDALDHSFGHRFARFDRPGRDATIRAAELLAFVRSQPDLAAVSSHHIRYPLPEARGILFFDLCFLRDPIDRVRSMYDYYRDKPADGDPVSELAGATDLGGFVAGMVRDFPLRIRNVQVNLIAAAGDSDQPTPDDLEIATARMLGASFPGVVDLFDQSIATGQYFLRQVFPELDFSLPPVNVSQGLGGTVESRTMRLREVCDSVVFDELLRLNDLDFQLVERTRAEVLRRAALVPPPGEVSESELPISKIFDAAWYLRKYPDVAAARIDPLRHYLKYGAAEGRRPRSLVFDPNAGDSPLHDTKSAALQPTRSDTLEIDEVVLDLANPRPRERRFLQAANRDQLLAQIRLQKR